jgi:hypothetical protein
MAIDKPMVATTMGIMPYLKRGSTTPRLNSQPSSSTASSAVHTKLTSMGAPSEIKPNIMKAGSITNSPWAKLMVPDACHSKVKPRAASA